MLTNCCGSSKPTRNEIGGHTNFMGNNTVNLRDAPKLEPSVLADQLERLPVAEAREILGRFTTDQCAAVVAQLETADAANLLATLPDERVTACLQLLPRNLAADLVGMLPLERRRRVLTGLPPEKATAISALLRYPPDSAGGIMDNRFIAVRAGQTVAECLALLRTHASRRADDVSYLYVIDETQRLVGVVSLRDLVFAPAEQRASEIMNREVRFLRVTDDQEIIAHRIRQTNLIGLPVVDEHARLVGVVRMRDALWIAQTEATEDMQLMVGLSGEERIWTPWKQSIARRLPWLGVNLGTALGAAAVVSFFEGTIARWTALVAFLPLICAVSGNAGNQALTVMIRSFALGEVAPGDAARAMRKELFIGAVNGLVLALALGLLAYLWKGSVLLGVVAGAAMLLNQVIGACAGIVTPFGLRWCKVDPALASSIFVTALTDTMGFLVFLGLATLAIRLAGL
jgi:magnesium transporter